MDARTPGTQKDPQSTGPDDAMETPSAEPRARRAMPAFIAPVSSSSTKGALRRLTLTAANGTKFQKTVHPFALVGKGDYLVSMAGSGDGLFVQSERPEEFIRLTPAFFRRVSRTLGDIRYEFTVAEPTSPADIAAWEHLERFHYKTSLESLASETDTIQRVGGRKAILLMYLRRAGFDEPAGYIELQMPLLMIKPRHELFSRPFNHPDQPVAWEKWGASEMKENVNRIVRVARVVVSPEFRGLGLAKQLLQTAIEFSRERWHVQGRRPLFLEISAEMLNHIDFVTSAGFYYIGSTEGNIARITKDLRSMSKGQKINFGVMTLQNKYYQNFLATAEKAGLSFDELLSKLETALSKGGPSFFTPSDWYLFRPVLRFPQRYYVMGLDDYSQQYVSNGRKLDEDERTAAPPRNYRIKVDGLSVRSRYELEQSDSVRAILDCFGIATTTLSTTIVRPVDLEIGPGQVALIAGASGSGKSVLLKALDPNFDEEHLKRTSKGALRLPEAGWISEINSDQPLIEYLSNMYGRDRTISVFHKVGLSEAFVFVKPFALLSRGQRYRAMLAELMLREAPVWLIDEFCADLDPVSASIVAHNLKRIAAQEGRIVVLAAANHEHFYSALKPTQVIYLKNSGKAEIYSYNEYRRMITGAVG